MKKILLLITLILFSFFSQAQSPMSGTYSINPFLIAPTNFNSFQQASDSLAFNGVSGPVLINVANVTYTQQVDIPVISGVSATNTVTFNGNNATLQNASTTSADRHTLRLSGADYVRFKKLNVVNTNVTYAYAVHLYNQSDNNIFDSCTMTVPANLAHNNHAGIVINRDTGSVFQISAIDGSDNNVIKNCTILNGYYGIVLFGRIASNGGNVVEKCTIQNFAYYGIFSRDQNANTLSSNDISRPLFTDTIEFVGVQISDCKNTLVEKNRIHDPFMANTTNVKTFTGVYVSDDASLGNENHIENNLIYNIESNGSIRGIYIEFSDYVEVYHNTIDINHSASTGGNVSGIFFNHVVIGPATGSGQFVRNNNISINRGGAGGQTCLTLAVLGATCDYNNFYITPSANHYVASDYGSFYNTLASWQASNSMAYDQHSQDLNPYYESPAIGNFKPQNVALDNKGTSVGVASDITGALRLVSPPDIGAYEFSGCAPMAGIYTIDPLSPVSLTNFITWQAAVDRLQYCGVNAAVTLNVLASHIFNEQIDIAEIPGASVTNTITFNGNNSTLTNDTTTTTERHTLRLSGADYVRFINLNFENTNSIFAYAVQLYNGSDNNIFDSCSMTVPANILNNDHGGVIINTEKSDATAANADNGCDSNSIKNCTIKNGYYGVVLNGRTSGANGYNRVENCIIQDFRVYGIYMVQQNTSRLSGNDISRPLRTNITTFYGVYATTGVVNSVIEKNKIHDPFATNTSTSSTSYGIRIFSDATLGNENQLVNNLFYNFESNGSIYGIGTSTADHLQIFHNTIDINHPASTASNATGGIYQIGTGSVGQDFRNNIVTINRGGTGTKNCINIEASGTTCDYNNLTINAGANNYIGSDGTDYATLATWKTASGGAYDQQSETLNPIYTAPLTGDFKPTNAALNNKGINVGVATDIENTVRTGPTPDMGAYEFVGCAPMAGIYTIDPLIPVSPTNFITWQAAVDKLITCGINAAVTFNILASHTFNEQIDIPQISGSSATNTVTFNGNNATLINSTTTTTERHTLRLSGADYFRFKNLNLENTNATFAYAVQLYNGSHNNIFDSSTITVPPNLAHNDHGGIIINTTTGDATATNAANGCDSNIIKNCIIKNGYYGVVLNGKTSGANGYNLVENCTIQDFRNYGIYVVRQNTSRVSQNDLSRPLRTNITTFTGVYSTTDVVNSVIEKNRIHDPCAADTTASSTNYGIRIFSDGTLGNENIIENNLIYNMKSNGTVEGITISGANYLNIYHNTIDIDHAASGTSNSTYGIYQVSSVVGQDYKNNIVTINRGGSGAQFCVRLTGTGTIINYNNYTIAPGVFHYIASDGTNYTTLASWQTSGGGGAVYDQNSHSLNPIYTAPATGNFEPTNAALDNQGTNVGVASDIKNAARIGATPDIGAYEFLNCTPMAGTYSINPFLPSGPTNFITWQAAVDKLVICGISAPVIINVLANHTFTEQIDIPEVTGSSAANTIIFNGNNATLINGATTTTERHTLRLSGADYFRFINLNFENTNTSFAYAVHLYNGSDNNIFDSCNITLPTNIFSSDQGGVIINTEKEGAISTNLDNGCDSNLIKNCTIKNGYYGIVLNGRTSGANGYNIVENCTIQDFRVYGIYVIHQNTSRLTGNNISRPLRTDLTSFIGVYTTSGVVNTVIEKNKIHDPFSSNITNTSIIYGIRTFADGSLGNENKIVNNLIYNLESNGGVYGIAALSASYLDVFHNTIDINNAASTSSGISGGIYQSGGSTVANDFRNNIITINLGGTGTKRCITISAAGTICDYNNLTINPGVNNFIGSDGTDYTTFATWQTASGGAYDQHSETLNPIYEESVTAFHRPTNFALENKGIASSVMDDILDATRSATTPDIGAYEFVGCVPKDLVLATSTNASSTAGLFVDSTVYNDGDSIAFRTLDCKLLASIKDPLGGNVLGEISFHVNVDTTVQTHNTQPYVRRWYEIVPSSNGPADVVLYFTQDDFDDYNVYATSNGWPLLPINSTDLSGMANVRITKIDGGGLGIGSPTVVTPSTSWNGPDARWEMSFPVTSFSRFYVHASNPGNVPLPINGLNFTATKDGNTSLLKWQTLSESDNDYFDIQRSVNGREFLSIGRERSKTQNGNSVEMLNYKFIDNAPNNGINYYRLAQVNLNGIKNYSSIVQLVWGDKTIVTSYPNPVQGMLNIDIYASQKAKYDIRFLDMSGRIILSKNIVGEQGKNAFQLNVQSLSTGFYAVEVLENGNAIYSAKVRKE